LTEEAREGIALGGKDWWVMEKHDEILRRAIIIYGEESQIDMMIEECSEIIKALCKYKRYGETSGIMDMVREEAADTKIMLRQMEIIFGSVDEFVDNKIERLKKSLYLESL
jgi:predicted RNA-binding protein with PIN domain